MRGGHLWWELFIIERETPDKLSTDSIYTSTEC